MRQILVTDFHFLYMPFSYLGS